MLCLLNMVRIVKENSWLITFNFAVMHRSLSIMSYSKRLNLMIKSIFFSYTAKRLSSLTIFSIVVDAQQFC